MSEPFHYVLDSPATEEDCHNLSEVSSLILSSGSPDSVSQVRRYLSMGLDNIAIVSQLLFSYRQVPLLEQQQHAVIQTVTESTIDLCLLLRLDFKLTVVFYL
jgi:hypothetical protein